MLWIVREVWRYKAEIILATQFLSELRKTAKEAAQDYIRKKIRSKLTRQISLILAQIIVLLVAYFIQIEYRNLGSRLFASFVLWCITIYNLLELTLVSIPELASVYRSLRGKTGFALKYFLQVSIVSEFLRWNVVFLVLCFSIVWASRATMATRFSFTEPWSKLTHLVLRSR